MTDTTPTPTPRERERIGRALQKAFAADPMDRMLQDYRPMTAADVLRFDVHWLGPEGRPGWIEPLHATDRMQVKPLSPEAGARRDPQRRGAGSHLQGMGFLMAGNGAVLEGAIGSVRVAKGPRKNNFLEMAVVSQ